MAYAQIEALLKQAMGLDAATIGEGSVERAARARMAACGLADVAAYVSRLYESAAERQALIETVVVPETWFFRDRDTYAALAHVAREEYMPLRAQGIIRLLSVPCSTGEEPYSIAMTLAEAGFPPARYDIDAADISFRAIEHALQGLYGRNSFRSADLGFRDRYFEAGERGYRLRADVRARVRFRQGNLLADDFPFTGERYDFVFCRNVLIYFDRRTQDKAIRALDGLLDDNGTLFVGSSETGLLLDHGFHPLKLPLAFAFRKPGTASTRQAGFATHAPAKKPLSVRPKAVASREALRHGTLPDTRVRDPAVASQQAEPGSMLEQALRLADRGSFADAARLCEQHLRKHGPAAGAFYLLGLVREAAGESRDAEAFYRKALYLEPNHQETLAHLALLRANLGDGAGARLLRERIGRLQRGEGQ
jgi:chemotaxis protein methyltransferase WspC